MITSDLATISASVDVTPTGGYETHCKRLESKASIKGSTALRIRRQLRVYDKSDGQCIRLSTLMKKMPERRWDFRILGESSQGRTVHTKLQPIVARIHGQKDIVVLVSSLRIWMHHHNPEDPQGVEESITRLVKFDEAHDRYVRAQSQSKRKQTYQDMKSKRPAKKETPNSTATPIKSDADNALWGAWGSKTTH
jgi:hypothetical protein